ncbi:MAG TPA: YbhB/YbcL family Raf kinase inhibitor-like protein [Opitutaceae bacterium]|nr:YbhB/YbcL family Raf kinase inhibitor-like protein [Opitutaceae bacterium]
MQLISSSFPAGTPMPATFTCDGPNLSPPLSWMNTPPRTRSYAVICDDPDAPGGDWVHWVIYAIPSRAIGLPENLPAAATLADGTRQGTNGFARIGYGGPCPPHGRPHRYVFKLYALDTNPPLDPGLSKADLLRAIDGQVLAEAELTGTYARQP